MQLSRLTSKAIRAPRNMLYQKLFGLDGIPSGKKILDTLVDVSDKCDEVIEKMSRDQLVQAFNIGCAFDQHVLHPVLKKGKLITDHSNNTSWSDANRFTVYPFYSGPQGASIKVGELKDYFTEAFDKNHDLKKLNDDDFLHSDLLQIGYNIHSTVLGRLRQHSATQGVSRIITNRIERDLKELLEAEKMPEITLSFFSQGDSLAKYADRYFIPPLGLAKDLNTDQSLYGFGVSLVHGWILRENRFVNSKAVAYLKIKSSEETTTPRLQLF